METTSKIPASRAFSAARLKGRSRGALICGIFGAVWMFEALYFGRIATPVWLTIIAIFTIVFVVWPMIRLYSLRHLPYSLSDRQRWPAISKAYWTIVAIEWLVCAVAVNWLLHIHRYDLMPQYFGVIIGLHFLPLARIFRAPIYYATGAVMALGVLASLAIPAGHVRDIAAFSIDGLSLWATAAVILCQDLLSSRATEGITLAVVSE